ncbi:lactonase family protein [soil metagenome]
MLKHLLAAAMVTMAPVSLDGPTLELVSKLPDTTIVSIADGDFVAASDDTGVLAPAAAGLQDQLIVTTIRAGKATTRSLRVSNSVTATPEVLAVTPDGATAFVIERLAERTPGALRSADLQPGKRLFAIDLRGSGALAITDTVEVGAFPEGLSISPDGTRVAVVSNTPQAALLQFVDYRAGRFGGVTSVDLATLGITGTASTARGGVTATAVQWHRSGRFVAVNIDTQDRVAFFELTGTAQRPVIRAFGEPVAVGRDPFVGRFTPDGRHYVVAEWGRDFSATTLAGRIPATASTLSVIRFDAAGARHARIGGAVSDLSSEGIAMSRDGRLVATINMRGTALPLASGRLDRDASVTLLTLDPSTGALVKVADYRFEGVLPEGGSFDSTGNHFYASVFQGHEGASVRNGPGIEVFGIVKGAPPSLVALGRIPTPHGVHHIAIP